SAEFISFLGTLLSTTQVSQSVIILSLYYIYRLKLSNPHIRGMEGSEFRLAVIALMLANKFLDDNTYTNKTWSEVSGISLGEINLMEREFLAGVEHSLYIDYGTYQHW
ncbi:cyclin PHO80-like protein, partial [Cantharellus anzutake]